MKNTNMNKEGLMPIVKFIVEMDKEFIDNDNRYNLSKEHMLKIKYVDYIER